MTALQRKSAFDAFPANVDSAMHNLLIERHYETQMATSEGCKHVCWLIEVMPGMHAVFCEICMFACMCHAHGRVDGFNYGMHAELG